MKSNLIQKVNDYRVKRAIPETVSNFVDQCMDDVKYGIGKNSCLKNFQITGRAKQYSDINVSVGLDPKNARSINIILSSNSVNTKANLELELSKKMLNVKWQNANVFDNPNFISLINHFGWHQRKKEDECQIVHKDIEKGYLVHSYCFEGNEEIIIQEGDVHTKDLYMFNIFGKQAYRIAFMDDKLYFGEFSCSRDPVFSHKYRGVPFTKYNEVELEDKSIYDVFSSLNARQFVSKEQIHKTLLGASEKLRHRTWMHGGSQDALEVCHGGSYTS